MDDITEESVEVVLDTILDSTGVPLPTPRNLKIAAAVAEEALDATAVIADEAMTATSILAEETLTAATFVADECLTGVTSIFDFIFSTGEFAEKK